MLLTKGSDSIDTRVFFARRHVLRRANDINNTIHKYCIENDPSAGSPTETLLRLLLPLDDQVWASSRPHGRSQRPV